MKRWQKIYIIFFVLGFIFLIIASFFNVYEPTELKIYDFFLRLRPRETSLEEIFLVAVEEKVNEDGLWPWRNEWLVYLLNYLSGVGVRAILVDSSLEKYLIAEHPLLKSCQTRTPVFYPQKDAREIEDGDLIFDRDGKVRRYNLSSEKKDSLVLQAFLSYAGIDKKNLSLAFPKEILINYNQGKYSTRDIYSYFDLVISIFLTSRREIPKVNFSRLKDRICVIGMSPMVTSKFYPTPLNLFSSLEIRLQVLENLIKGNFLRQVRQGENAGIALLISLLSLGIFLKVHRFKRFFFMSLLVFSYLLVSFLIFFLWNIWIDNFLTSASVIYIFLAITIYRYGEEQIIKREEKKKEIARKLKSEIFINNSLVTDNLEIIIKTSSTHEAEGDFFDIVKLDNNQFGVLIGKAPGKNLEAVSYITKLVNEFRLQAPLHKRPRTVLNAVNNILFAEGAKGMYATCLYLLIDTEKKILTFANAGHEPLLLASEGSQEIILYEASDSTPLGIARNMGFSDQDVKLNKGDLIVGFTSGIVEVKNREGKEFGIHSLKEIINQYRTWNIAKLINKVFEKIHRFSQGKELHCECSLLLIRVKEHLVKEKEVLYERKETLVREINQ